MMPADSPVWMTIAQWVVSPVLGGLGAIWASKRKERDRIRAHIIFRTRQSNDGDVWSEAVMSVQNMCDHDVFVARLIPRMRFLYLWEGENTAASWGEDWDDGVDFPIRIEPGKENEISLERVYLGDLAKTSGRIANALGKLVARPRLKIEVRLLSGHRVLVSGEGALRYDAKETWYDKPWWRLEVSLPRDPDPFSLLRSQQPPSTSE